MSKAKAAKLKGFSRVGRNGQTVLGKKLPNGCMIYQELDHPASDRFSAYNERGQLLGLGDLQQATAAAENNYLLATTPDWAPSRESLSWIWSAAIRAGAPAYCVWNGMPVLDGVHVLALSSDLFLAATAPTAHRPRREFEWWDFMQLRQECCIRTNQGIQLLRLRPLLNNEIYRPD